MADDKTDIAKVVEGSRESRMVVLRRDRNGKPTVWCDPEIADLVEALQSVGTVASCCGHGGPFGNIALADGRELIIAPNFDAARSFESAMSFVKDLASAPKSACSREETAWEWREKALTITSRRGEG